MFIDFKRVRAGAKAFCTMEHYLYLMRCHYIAVFDKCFFQLFASIFVLYFSMIVAMESLASVLGSYFIIFIIFRYYDYIHHYLSYLCVIY